MSQQRSAWLCLPVVGILVGLCAPQPAQAHIQSGIVATEYRATVAPLQAPLRGAVAVRIYDTDRALRLAVAPGHSVTVLAPGGRPLLRAGRGSRDRAVVWHDPRLRGLPAGVDRARWTVPVILDGARFQIEGSIRRVRAPPAWLWLIVAASLAASTALVVVLVRPSALRGARFSGWVAAAATIAVSLTFALSSSATAGSRFVAFDLLVFAAVGIAAGRSAEAWPRIAAAGGLGLLALFVGLLRSSVLIYGVVLSPLPATATRALVVLALWAGVAAIAAAALAAHLELGRSSGGGAPPPRRVPRRGYAPPRRR